MIRDYGYGRDDLEIKGGKRERKLDGAGGCGRWLKRGDGEGKGRRKLIVSNCSNHR